MATIVRIFGLALTWDGERWLADDDDGEIAQSLADLANLETEDVFEETSGLYDPQPARTAAQGLLDAWPEDAELVSLDAMRSDPDVIY